MELKPGLQKLTRLDSARTDTGGGNDRINHAHAGSRRRDVSEPLAQKVSGSWVRGEPGLWTVKLGRGVKVEESKKHEVGAADGKFPRLLPPCDATRRDAVKFDKGEKIVHRLKCWRFGGSTQVLVCFFFVLFSFQSVCGENQ